MLGGRLDGLVGLKCWRAWNVGQNGNQPRLHCEAHMYLRTSVRRPACCHSAHALLCTLVPLGPNIPCLIHSLVAFLGHTPLLKHKHTLPTVMRAHLLLLLLPAPAP